MELMKDLFTKSASTPPTVRLTINEKVVDRETRPCMFDLNCPVVNCPFRSDELPNAYVDRLIDGTTKSPNFGGFGKQKPVEQPAGVDIEDDADLFAIQVGRVDPCMVNTPVYRNKNTQYLDTDVPAEFQLPIEPSVKVKPKSKPKKDKKKGKKNTKKNSKKKKKPK